MKPVRRPLHTTSAMKKKKPTSVTWKKKVNEIECIFVILIHYISQIYFQAV